MILRFPYLDEPLQGPPPPSLEPSARVRWRPLIPLTVDDAGNMLQWPAVVAFSTAGLKYPLLGLCGCLEFLDVKFLGSDHAVELEPNARFPQRAFP